MAPRNAISAAFGEMDMDAFLPTQDSSSGDDAVMNNFLKHMQAAAEKKAKARDAKLIQAYKTECQKLIATKAEGVRESLKELFQELDVIAQEEAENEDAIRKLWMEIGRGHSEKMKQYCEIADKLEEARMADGIPHLHAVRAVVNDVEKAANALYREEEM